MANLNIKDAKEADLEAFKQIKLQYKCKSSHDVLSLLIKRFTSEPGSVDPIPENKQELESVLKEVTHLESKITGLNVEITFLENQVTELKDKQPKGKQFLYTPTDQQAQKMQRVISYLIVKGKLLKSDPELLQKFTSKSIDYTIENEFSSIQK